MSPKFIETALPGVLLIETHSHNDNRGYFRETYHQEKYQEQGLHKTFIQDNLSHSKKNVLRGLHYQLKHPQGKFVFVAKGEIFDVAVDIRLGSPTFGKWIGTYLTEDNNRQIYIPEGFAHGYCTLSETSYVVYKCTEFYKREDEYGILWSDPTVAIQWPISTPILSGRDKKHPLLDDVAEELLPLC